MNKEKPYRKTIGYIKYSGPQSLRQTLPRPQRTVGESDPVRAWSPVWASQGHAHQRLEGNDALVGRHAGSISAQPRIASHGKSILINEV